MREFKQLTNFMLANEDFVQELAEKTSAKILVISDSHGSKQIISSILEKFGREVDALCFCGDGISDLLGIIEYSSRNLDFEKNIPPAIIFVQGNGDYANYTLLTNDRIAIQVPQQNVFFVAGKKIMITHGHRYNVYIGTKALKAEAEKENIDVVFYGHTHIANAQTKINSKTGSKICILNPGSCSSPRRGLPHTFAILTIDKDNDKIEHCHFEIKWTDDGDIGFIPYNAPSKDVNLFW